MWGFLSLPWLHIGNLSMVVWGHGQGCCTVCTDKWNSQRCERHQKSKTGIWKVSEICCKRLMRHSSISNANVDAFTSWPRRQRDRGKVQKLSKMMTRMCELRRILESGVWTPSGTSSQWLLYLVNSNVRVLSLLSWFFWRKTKINPSSSCAGANSDNNWRLWLGQIKLFAVYALIKLRWHVFSFSLGRLNPINQQSSRRDLVVWMTGVWNH